MGFMDKAKKLAEQAQTKLDEAQKQFNESQSRSSSPPPPDQAVEYDKHGRPVRAEEPPATTPPHGDPLAGEPAAQPAPPSVPGAAAPVPDPAAPPPDTPQSGKEEEDRNHPGYEPPKLSSGDPLAP